MKKQTKNIIEPKKETPIFTNVDVVVCGGGPAGIAAAVSASKNGANTILIERYGFLGGTATAGLVIGINGFYWGKKQIIGGIAQDLVNRMVALNGAVDDVETNCVYFNPDVFKYASDCLIKEAGVKILLHTLIVAPIMEGNRICGVIVENKSGRLAIKAKVVIDATGDGDIAARAGNSFEIGRKEDGLMQPMGSYIVLTNVDEPDNSKPNVKEMVELMTDAAEKGKIPDFMTPIIYRSPLPGRNEQVVIHVLRKWGNATNTEDLTRVEIGARKDLFDFIKLWKKNLNAYKSCYLVRAPIQLGIRETRRITGDYILTGADIESGNRFPDVIARGAWPIDIHPPKEIKGTHQIPNWEKDIDAGLPLTGGLNEPYDIPYRCLLAKDIDQLLIAGRCISTTHEALASVRVMAPVMAIGQAAGTAAALSIKKQVSPRDLSVKLLQKYLKKQGAKLE